MRVTASFAAFALLFATPACAADAPLSASGFRDRLAESMTKATGHPTRVVDERTFVTKDAGGEELTIYVDNAYNAYLAEPAELEAILERFSRILAVRPSISRPDQLTVIVRPSNYLRESVGSAASLAEFPAARSLAGDMSIFLAIDGPETIQLAKLDDLKQWKLTEEQAWAQAISSLKERIGPIGIAELEAESGSSVLVADSGLAPSVLADPTFCGPSAPVGPGGAFVFLLSRDAVLIGFPDQKASIKTFWKLVKRHAEQGTGISSTAMICEKGSWKVAAGPK